MNANLQPSEEPTPGSRAARAAALSPTLPPEDSADAPAEELIAWALESFHPRAAVVTSFQAEGMVILDMACRLRPAVRVITLDTGRLPPETYEMVETVRERYGVQVEVFFPDARRVEAMVRRSGPNLFYDSAARRQECCHVRKVEPLERALSGLDAWLTGLRRDQAPDRADTPRAAPDLRFGGGRETPLWKLAPLADWTWDDVQSYVQAHDVPLHPLYARGYTSIGCAPCTRAPRPGEGPRAGRWWWERDEARECGLHVLREDRS